MVKFATREQVQQRTVEQVVPLVTDQGSVEVPLPQIVSAADVERDSRGGQVAST